MKRLSSSLFVLSFFLSSVTVVSAASQRNIISVTLVSSTVLRVEYKEMIDASVGADVVRYQVKGFDWFPKSAALTNPRMVELTFDGPAPQCGKAATLEIKRMRTRRGRFFADTAQFTVPCPPKTPEVRDWEADLSISLVPGAEQLFRRSSNKQVQMFSLNLHSGCSDTTYIDQLLITHKGTGSSTDVVDIHPMLEGIAVESKRSFDLRTRQWTVLFRPPLQIPACAQQQLSFSAAFSTRAQPGVSHRLELTSGADVGTTRSVRGSFPLTGERVDIR